MEFLLREVIYDQGQTLLQDSELVDDEISIGSAPDQLIQLLGTNIRREHAALKFVDGKLWICCKHKNDTLVVCGKAVNSTELKIGDELTIDSHLIKIVDGPAGFDAACELTVDSELQERAYESMFVTDLSQTFIGNRGPAYILSFLVVLIAFVWPFSAYLLRDSNTGIEASKDNHHSDIYWSTGPLLPAHQLEIGDDCSACHKAAFQQVQDEACIACHQTTHDHIDMNSWGHLDMQVGKCQGCHREHNEPQSIVVSNDALCVDCHKFNIVSPIINEKITEVTGFFDGAHPAFKLDYLLSSTVKKGSGVSVEWHRKKHAIEDEIQENSNLKFPHDAHLDIDKVQKGNTGDAMVCGDCHTLKADQEHFKPISMEEHCSSCHDLSFDIEQPDKKLPHGDPMWVIRSIEEHFVKVYTDPNFKSSKNNRLRRLPGKNDVVESCKLGAFQCGMERAKKQVKIEFTQRTCVMCHEVSDNGSDDIYSRWQVLPVKITDDWYLKGIFDHASHLTQRGQNENKICGHCHEATASQFSQDVMIPGIDNCLSCHGDESTNDKVVVGCLSCHAFHFEKLN